MGPCSRLLLHPAGQCLSLVASSGHANFGGMAMAEQIRSRRNTVLLAGTTFGVTVLGTATSLVSDVLDGTTAVVASLGVAAATGGPSPIRRSVSDGRSRRGPRSAPYGTGCRMWSPWWDAKPSSTDF